MKVPKRIPESRSAPSAARASEGDGAYPVTAIENIPPAGTLDGETQTTVFEKAIRHFHAGEFRKAKELFERATRGPGRDVAHSARLHIRMCQQRLERPQQVLQTAEDHYNYAVALINERRLQEAEQHLRQALSQSSHGDHIYYALALVCALGGDLAGASTNMQRAIELQPRNRIAARNDPDFAGFGRQPPLASLLYPEKGYSG